jgi:polyisoprenoid-binding protein YceI
MIHHFTRTIVTLAALTVAFALTAADHTKNTTSVNIVGAATFVANTDVPTISVTGRSTALRANTLVREDQAGIKLERIEAWVPVNTLNTGMSFRDEHMRKLIFTTADGKVPDVRFEAGKTTCPAPGAKRNTTCQVAGTLSIRGVSRPFAVTLKVHQQAQVFKVVTDGTIRLSDYGIDPPSEFAVKTKDEVELHLEFTGIVTGPAL